MIRNACVIGLTAVLVTAASPPDNVKPPHDLRASGNLITGSVPDDGVVDESPFAGVIVTEKRFNRVVKAWGVERPFAVDFDRQFVVVVTTQGSELELDTQLVDGDLKVKVLGTADLTPGFRYALLRVDRAGIKTVNGKPLPTE